MCFHGKCHLWSINYGVSRCQNCEDGWDYHDNFCYYVSPIEKQTAWNSAETQCQNMNANLLSVKDNAEYDAILNMRSVKDANAWLWIGLHRLSGSSKDNFEWTDGTPYKEISYRPNGIREVSVWPDGEPTDKDGYDCARLRMLASVSSKRCRLQHIIYELKLIKFIVGRS